MVIADQFYPVNMLCIMHSKNFIPGGGTGLNLVELVGQATQIHQVLDSTLAFYIFKMSYGFQVVLAMDGAERISGVMPHVASMPDESGSIHHLVVDTVVKSMTPISWLSGPCFIGEWFSSAHKMKPQPAYRDQNRRTIHQSVTMQYHDGKT